MKVYLAGSSQEGNQAKALAKILSANSVEVLCSWPGFIAGDESEMTFWSICLDEITQADKLVIITPANASSPLRGALIEAGIALGLAKPVIIFNPQFRFLGTWPDGLGLVQTPNVSSLIELINAPA